MKILLFSLLLIFAVFKLEAAHFQSSMSVVRRVEYSSCGQTYKYNEFFVEIQIKKVVDDNSSPLLIASPKLICFKNQPASFVIESDDKNALLSVQIEVSGYMDINVNAHLLLEEDGQVVLDLENFMSIS